MLNDVYEEQLVARPTSLGTVFLKGLVYFLAVVLFLCGFLFKPLFILGLAAIFGAYYLTRRFDVEFEYIYVNGELDVDKILGKASRKRVVTVNVDKMESIAPYRERPDNPRSNAAVYDCTSGDGKNVYEMVVRNDDGLVRLLFQPKQEILDAIVRIAPRKVTTY